MNMNKQNKKHFSRLVQHTAAWLLAAVTAVAGTWWGPGASFTAEAAPNLGKETSAKTYITAKDWPKGPEVEAYSAVLMEADTGTVLYAKNPDTIMYPASITKILTALITLENFKLDDVITYTEKANAGIPSGYTRVWLSDGEEITVEDSLYTLLLYSTNDIANGLGIAHSGSVKEYAEYMNQRAKELGAKNTHFTNPSGVEDDNHYTTAYDMCRIMRACIQNEDFNKISATRTHTLPANNKRKDAFTYANKCSMLMKNSAYYYPYVVSGKTGYHDISLNTLVTYAEKDGMKLICCVMKCGKGKSYKDSKLLYDFGFNNFKVADTTALDSKYSLENVGIFANDSGIRPGFSIEVKKGSNVVLPINVNFSKLDQELVYLENAEDGSFAEINYSYEGMKMGSTRLMMKADPAKQGEASIEGSSSPNENPDHESNGESAAQPMSPEGGEFSSSSKVVELDIRLLVAGGVALIALIVLLVIYIRQKMDNRIRYDKKVKINWKRKR